MKKNIIIASSALLLSSIFFVINDGIINYLSSQNIQFYHFIFYGSPAYIAVPIFLLIRGTLKKNITVKEIIKSMMPGGSVIGCPKISTLELLNNQEKQDRNIPPLELRIILWI